MERIKLGLAVIILSSFVVTPDAHAMRNPSECMRQSMLCGGTCNTLTTSIQTCQQMAAQCDEQARIYACGEEPPKLPPFPIFVPPTPPQVTMPNPGMPGGGGTTITIIVAPAPRPQCHFFNGQMVCR